MAIKLDHVIVPSKDKLASAQLFAEIFGLQVKASEGRFAQVPIDLFVGALELLSEFVRIISFTFRLFGNMTAGEILLLVITYLVPFILVLPFYGLELLVGGVQALIFAGLTLVFVVVAVTPHSEEEHS